MAGPTQINGFLQIRDGSIPAAKVTSEIIIASGGNAFTGNQSMGGNLLTNLAAPSSGTDAVNKDYLVGAIANAINGFDWKQSVRAASLTSVTLASGVENGDTVGGVVLATGDRVALMGQTAGAENGIYVVQASGQPIRADDADSGDDVTSGMTFHVEEGSNANTTWTLITDDPFILDTDALTFAQISSGGTTYTAGTGIDITSNVISVTFGTTSGTVCQGNDSRLSDARTPVGTALTSAHVWVGTSGNVAASVAISGDLSISNTGVATVTGQVKLAKYIVRETPSGTVNGSNLVFTLANTPESGTEQVFLNGLLQDAGSGNDYTISGGTITMQNAPDTGDKIRVTYIST